MKKILKPFFAAMCCMFLMACSSEPSFVSEGRELYQKYFHYILKDPDSFKVYKEEYQAASAAYVDWVLDYGARNGLGGMVRNTIEFKTCIMGLESYIEVEGVRYKEKDLE